MHRSPAWFDRQLAHARACIAEADKHHTSEEIAEAHAALDFIPDTPQQSLFRTASRRIDPRRTARA